MQVGKDAIIHLKNFLLPLAFKTGIGLFHKFPNQLWYFYVHKSIPRRGRADIRDLAFFNKYDQEAIAFGPYVDKELVKDFVRGMTPGIRVPKTYDVLKTPDALGDLNLDHPYVAKPTHSSGVAILKPEGGALSEKEVRVLGGILEENYYLRGGEIQYKYLEKKIIVEEFIGEPPEAPPDFKVSCYQGRSLFTSVVFDRYAGQRQIWLDREGRPVPIHLESPWMRKEVHPYEGPFEVPENYREIISVAESLSQAFRFVRVDLFTHGGEIFFGEFTFSPNNLLNIHFPLKYNEVGTWLESPAIP